MLRTDVSEATVDRYDTPAACSEYTNEVRPDGTSTSTPADEDTPKVFPATSKNSWSSSKESDVAKKEAAKTYHVAPSSDVCTDTADVSHTCVETSKVV